MVVTVEECQQEGFVVELQNISLRADSTDSLKRSEAPLLEGETHFSSGNQ